MAALSLGISAKLVYAIAWAIAFMAAGVGGSLLGNINGITVSVGYLGLLVLPAVVIGGLNSVPGAIVGGILIGLLQNFAGGYLDPLTIAGIKIFPGGIKDIFPFVVMTLVLLVKPYGLFGWKRIERV
jgi:branched-chain amino acid transport system permease protein